MAVRAGIMVLVLVVVAVLGGLIIMYLEVAPLLNDWVNWDPEAKNDLVLVGAGAKLAGRPSDVRLP
jgi:hypothetical protein